ncbi:MAG: branched-chain amino acid ABC transporter permease [Nitrospirae bacterium]|nr:branched-chain amino acid ABC transporter permease [Nitrospirota bacterium]MBF0618304.1 branched-chain amino acid ABC transporter permease [Nitrospirota bacterium]
MSYLIQQFLNILQLGSLYALIAIGYTMVYGVLSLINFAHGDVFMLGAFIFFLAALWLKLSFIPALIVTVCVTACVGVLIERLAYRPLRNAPKMSAVITALGVGVFLENFTLALSPYPQHIPEIVKNRAWVMGQVTVSSIQTIIIAISVTLMVILDFLVRKTRFGMALRAISWDISAVPLMGIPVNRIISQTFALGAALGGAAGVMYSLAYPVIDPYMGIMIGWKAFISAVVGGIGNVRGAMTGGFILGTVEIAVTMFLPSTYRDIVAFTLLFVLLIFRPYGIFGTARLVKL